LKGLCLEHAKGAGHVDALGSAQAAYDAAIAQDSAGMALRAGNDVARHCLHINKPDKIIALLDDLTQQLQHNDPTGSEVQTAQQHLAQARQLVGAGSNR